MSIYRGAGGAGDAIADSSSEALLVRELAIEVQADADAAAASATAAAGSASTASTQATNSGTSATAAATSATNASNSATSASTSATNAANSATAAQTAETAAELAETNAETAETNAAASASAASSSASSASTSATNAASAQSAAESARDATLAAYDSFDDRYLGSKSTAPTLDNDGNALVGGALYFDTVSQGMKVYTGSAWVDAYVPGSTYLAKASNLSDLTSVSTARTNLGLAVGTNVQAWDADLDSIAAIAGTLGLLKKTAANTWSLDTSTYLTSAVTSVTGTSPVVSSGGATPDISIPAATTSVSGYLTSTDWNTFNGKQAAGSYVTSGGALGTPSSGTLTNCTFPTLNQNTTGSAASVSGTSSNGYGTRTVSTSAPSGGSNGDIWYKV